MSRIPQGSTPALAGAARQAPLDAPAQLDGATFEPLPRSTTASGASAAPSILLPAVSTRPSELSSSAVASSASMVDEAREMRRAAAGGAPADRLADQASRLFDGLQGHLLTSSDASAIKQETGRALDALRSAPEPREPGAREMQSVAEGQLARAVSLMELGIAKSV